MAYKAGFFLLVLAFGQVLTEYLEADFIENVNKKAAESIDSRIVSGWEAVPGQHPHQVSLRMVGPDGGVSGCGGSVIHRQWVLSAAHCTAGRITIVVRAGVVNMTDPEYISETTIYFNHPTYNDLLPLVVQPNDITVLRLIEPVVFTDNLQPIRLQTRADAFRNYAGLQVHASGYGRVWTNGASPEVLNWVYLRGVSNAECYTNFGTIITENSICARFFNVTSQSVCQGDSGGPLVHVGADSVPTLIGVTSFVAGGDSGCHSGFPAGFIRPGPFIDWLLGVTGIDFEDEGYATEAPTEAPTDPPTVTPTEEPTASPTEAPTEAPTYPPTTEQEPPVTTELPPDTTPEPEPEESEEDSEEDSNSSEEDPELADLLKRLEVKVKVKVQMNKYDHRHEHEHEHVVRRKH